MKKISLTSVLILLYAWFVIFNSWVFSFSEAEKYIDGDEVKNICQAMRMYVVDDYRGEMAVITLIAIIPVFIFCLKVNFLRKTLSISLLVFLLIWIYGFFIKYKDCPWF